MITNFVLNQLCIALTNIWEAYLFIFQPLASIFGIDIEFSGLCTLIFGNTPVN